MSESLEESAAAYTKATAKKCILEKVDVKTGEESESNVLQVKDKAGYFAWRHAANNMVRMFYNLLFSPLLLQMQCKLYVFEKTAQSWIERGRGLLRLNDMASTDDGTLQSRLGKSTFKKLLERGKKPLPVMNVHGLFLQFSHPNSFSGRKHLWLFLLLFYRDR